MNASGQWTSGNRAKPAEISDETRQHNGRFAECNNSASPEKHRIQARPTKSVLQRHSKNKLGARPFEYKSFCSFSNVELFFALLQLTKGEPGSPKKPGAKLMTCQVFLSMSFWSLCSFAFLKSLQAVHSVSFHIAVFRRVQGRVGKPVPRTVRSGLVGNVESTHVSRSKGKTTLVAKVGKCCNIKKITYMIITCDEDVLPGEKTW